MEKNPLYSAGEDGYRPRGLTQLNSTVSSMRTSLVMLGLIAMTATLCTMGAVIAGIEMTKELWVSNQGIVINDNPVATHQSVMVYDMDNLLLDMENPITSHLEEMRYVTLNTPEWSSKHTIESWRASDVYNYFQVNTTDGNTLTFNGTHLDWNDDVIAEVVEEEPETERRSLLGWKERLAKKVKKKLDSPMCNTEALVEKVRGLKFATAPACHVGVSAAKIYMHYNN